MKITTTYTHPPIPERKFDWTAYRDPKGIIGWGETEAEAIEDLKQQESENV